MELLRVSAARAELEYKIAERMEDIKRIQENIKIQEKAEEDIKKKLHNLGG